MSDDTPISTQTGAQGAQTGAGAASGGATKKEYNIPKIVLDKYPELVELIKKTESMADEEREYWFQILPIMTDEQVSRLKNILTEEAEQLAKLDDQYQGELAKLNQKHLDEWSTFQKKKDRESLQKAEAEAEVSEKAKEEDILGQLSADDTATTGAADASAASA
ncbi:MAG: hypothetical protein WC846_01555 [Candidatus Gracilibacteria bacterium]|jgi:hypothetical protein